MKQKDTMHNQGERQAVKVEKVKNDKYTLKYYLKVMFTLNNLQTC